MSGYAAEASNPTYWIAFSMKWNIVFDNKKLFDICFLNSSLSSQVGRISSASSDHLFKVHLGCRVTLRVIRVWVSGYAAEASNPTYRIAFLMKWNIVFENKKLFDVCFLNSSLSNPTRSFHPDRFLKFTFFTSPIFWKEPTFDIIVETGKRPFGR